MRWPDERIQATLGQIESWLFGQKHDEIERFLEEADPLALPSSVLLGVLAITRFERPKNRDRFLHLAEPILAERHGQAQADKWLRNRR